MSDAALRGAIFLGLLLLFGVAEWRWPRHQAKPQRRRRWLANLGFGLLGVLCLRLLMPWLAVDAAAFAWRQHLGLLPWLNAPVWLAIGISLLALDLMIYVQHRVMHRFNWLWRMHRVHHSDLALDVTSAVRFHPLEMLFSMLLKIAAVLALGAPVMAVVVFEIVLNGFAMFTHANLAIPAPVDRWLRRLVITPDMHRIHHSVIRQEQDSNFGFNLACWDYLFGSYRAQPAQPHASLALGLDRFRSAHDQRFDQLLLQPFNGVAADPDSSTRA